MVFLGARFKTTKDVAMISMPAKVTGSGFSVGSKIQLNVAPKTGIRNFQKFRSDTLVPRLLSSTVHMEMAIADSILNHPSER